MDREQAKKIIPILQGFVDGGELQENRSINEGWRKQSGALVVCQNAKIRIKPKPREPREWWINTYRNTGHSHTVHGSEEIALKFADEHVEQTIKVREILD